MAIGLGPDVRLPLPGELPLAVRRDAACTAFWRRWHISLSTWFRDYLYIPLGGNRVSPARRYRNLVTVFFLCGLWHGASWNFVIWGLWHGSFLVIERLCRNRAINRTISSDYPITALPPDAAWPIWPHVYTLAIVMIGWVFFRAETLPGAIAFLRSLAGLTAAAPTPYTVGWYLTPELMLALARRRDRIGAAGCRRWPRAIDDGRGWTLPLLEHRGADRRCWCCRS